MQFKTVFHATQDIFLNLTETDRTSADLAQLHCLSVVFALRLQFVLSVLQTITTLQQRPLANHVE